MTNLEEKYNSMPNLFRAFFTLEEISNVVENDDFYDSEDVSRSLTDKMSQEFDFALFQYARDDMRKLFRSLDFDGPDDEMVKNCVKDIDVYKDKTILLLSGKITFCVYNGSNETFKRLLNKLDNFESSNSQYGKFRLSDTYQTSDTPGISFNAIKNTDDTRYISAKYEFSYTL